MSPKILFKLINEKNYDSITVRGQNISLNGLKDKILVRLGQKKVTGPLLGKDRYRNIDDILVYDESKQLLTNESTLIASDKRVLVERMSIPRNLVGKGYLYHTNQDASLASNNPDNKSKRKESFLGLLASEIPIETCTTRAQTDDERSQSDREREGGMEYLEEMKEDEERADILGDINVDPVYFTDDWEDFAQKDLHSAFIEPSFSLEDQLASANEHSIARSENENECKNESDGSQIPFVASPQEPVTRPPVVRPPPPSTPCPQITQMTPVYSVYPQGYMYDQYPMDFYGLSNKRGGPQERIEHDDQKKEKRNRGIKQREWKNSNRDRRSDKERERDRERSRDKSRTKLDSHPRRQ